MSQAELARAAGISRTALSLIENRRLRPSVGTLQALERSLDPFVDPTLLRWGVGPLAAAELVRDIAAQGGLAYALTLDVAAWALTRYQTPAAAWAYVRPTEKWLEALRRRGVRRLRPGERADLVLLRGPDEVLGGAQFQGGFALVSTSRLLQDCARLGGRHALDAARLFLAYPEARSPGLRLDGDALLKVFEEVGPRT
jgi:transcriptional regulator with XRE-family HTH domain